jgi:hypothetical protein
MNLSNRRGSGNGSTRNPFTFAEVDDILKEGVSASVSQRHDGLGDTNLEHKHHARIDILVFRQLPHARKIHIEMCPGFLRIE